MRARRIPTRKPAAVVERERARLEVAAKVRRLPHMIRLEDAPPDKGLAPRQPVLDLERSNSQAGQPGGVAPAA